MRDDDALEHNPAVSRSALEAIHSQVFGWALSRCEFDNSAAEDLVQQAYVELLTGNARFKGDSSLKTFVFAVVQNLARSRFRKLANRLRILRENVHEFDSGLASHDYEESSNVWQAVKALPARQRDIIELVFCRELTVEEASGVMGITVGTGRVHYDRAKRALRERIAADLLVD